MRYSIHGVLYTWGTSLHDCLWESESHLGSLLKVMLPINAPPQDIPEEVKVQFSSTWHSLTSGLEADQISSAVVIATVNL